MRAEQAVFDGLSAAAPVGALVLTRIYPDQAPQDSDLPLIVFERSSTEAVCTIHEDMPVASRVTISASAWAKTRLAAEQVADEMQLALRQVGNTTDRFSQFDASTDAYAAVVAFDVWEL